MEQQELPFGIYDYSEFPPLIQIEFTGVNATDENFVAYLEEMAKLSEQPKRYISIVDTSKATYLSAKYRIMQGKYLEERKEKIAEKAIAAIFVAPSFLQRTVLKAIFIVKSYPSPVFIVASKEEAQEKVKELLEKERQKEWQTI
ncbi:hypothetical protein [Bernardetia sp.]|uniref:hypothetical protein n=1 Tax=Bernardetia sp. TaxID=1937974 RepID=UPI0025C28615|nr:hypothetical protein [Bernardetia sp.]